MARCCALAGYEAVGGVVGVRAHAPGPPRRRGSPRRPRCAQCGRDRRRCSTEDGAEVIARERGVHHHQRTADDAHDDAAAPPEPQPVSGVVDARRASNSTTSSSSSSRPPEEQQQESERRRRRLLQHVMRTGRDLLQERRLKTPSSKVASLATDFYRFLARFSGRRRPTAPWALLVLALSALLGLADACSSRTTPRPRPPAPTPRPSITFQTYSCPPAYEAWYCLNGATCFSVRVADALLYNCECVEGYMGPRCEYKDLDGSYFPSQRRFMLERASIAGGAAVVVLLAVAVSAGLYVHLRRRAKKKGCSSGHGVDCVDGAAAPPLRRPIFGTHYNHLQHQVVRPV